MIVNMYVVLVFWLGLFFCPSVTGNDQPTFTNLENKVVFNESVPVGTILFKCEASDSDSNTTDDGVLIFNIGSDPNATTNATVNSTVGNQERRFSVDAQTGEVRVAQPLDFEGTVVYRITMRVKNLGQPSREATQALLTIQMEDVNDNPPVCTPFVVLGQLNESSPINTTFTQLVCDDVDTGDGGKIAYEVIAGDTDVIGVDDNGNAFIVRTVDYEDGRDTYEATVLVKDKGTPMFSTNATVVLSLQDDDDNAPAFSMSGPYTATVREDTPIGTTILNIPATDADKPTTSASRIEYRFKSAVCSPDVLLIDRVTGDIIVKTDLDYESYQEIKCTVIASSSGTSGPSNSTDVIFTVTDANDRVPTFNETYYQTAVIEGQGINSLIANVSAEDPDNGPDGEVVYSIAGSLFSINAGTGAVTLKEVLDFEKDASFLVEITAADKGSPPKNSSVFLQVIVEPANEHEPQFHGPFEFDVKEDAVPGTSVFAVNATDDDRGLDGSISYAISQNVPFFIDANTGVVRVANNLDFETMVNPITFVVNAFDNSTTTQKSSSATLTATILDVNDVAVTCDAMSTQTVNFPFVIGEVLFSLTCDDPDLVASNLTYTISDGNDDGTFQIEPSKGNISLASPPQSTLYTLTVNVNDGVDSVNVSFYVITETVLNFTNLPQTIPVNEEELSTVGLLFTAKHCCSFPPVSLSIVNRQDDEKVALFGSSGDLYLLVPYDRETQATYVYEIQAEATSGQTAIGRLTVNVTDINDNAPIFSDNVYEVSVMEDLSVSSIISQFMAMDKDEGMNSMLDYKITNGNIGSTFSINATGHITLDQPLDYETLNTYTLVIEAFDAGSSPLTGTTTVIISVKNADEFKPTLVPLSVPFTSSLSEDEALGRSVFHVQAEDQDANITFTYSITSGNDDEDFNIVPETGYVYLAKLLDRERTPKYNITLTATDQNGVTKSGALEIEITDINDNNPVFSSAVYNLDINHGDPSGTLLPALIVSDADFGSNAAIDVSIIEESIPLSFQLNGLQLESMITMDYTNVKRYRLVVKAEDGGIPQRTSTAVVVVNVLPALTQPKFSPVSGNVTYNEDINVGFQIYDADATVLGAVENDQSMEYFISSGDSNNDFRVGKYDGEIVVNKALNYEVTSKYTLVITARDSAGTNQDDFILTVNVNNINEHFPVFGQDAFSFDVDEDASLSTPVGTVAATDDDGGILGTLTYSITGNEFSVDTVTGEIKVKEPLDYLTKSYYNLILTAADGDTLFPKTTKVSVVIRVKDVNNNPPVFISGTAVEVLDSIPSGSEVFQFRATDIDTNEIISYKINVPDPTNGKFTLDSNTGILRTAALLDVTDSPYILSVGVSDGVFTTNTTLDITVVAANPNFYDPVLVGPINVQKDRQTVMGADVATVLATDADDGNSGEVLYRITSGNNDGYFIIDASSGKITAATTFLNAENDYSLVIVAKDRGIPQRSASTTVNVQISPQKTISITPDYQFSIEENSPINSLVGKIDKDFDRTVSAYNVRSGNWNNAFTVTKDASDNGEIKVSSPLDYEVYQTYSLLIDVTTDIGVLPKVVEIKVKDINDNPPVFTSPTLALSVYEGTPIGYIVETISYTDADTLAGNTNNVLTLKDPGPSYFQINQLGELSLTVVPDHETMPPIVFDIVANDANLFSATVTVTFNILDLEEEEEVSPSTVTENALISLEVPFPASSGHLIHTLTPGDFGMSTSSTATYEYVSYDFSDPFSVDSTTGQLTVSSPSLLEDQSKYFHWVMCRASDSGKTESRVSLIRIDTFNRNTQMIVIELAESLTTVQSSLNAFRSRTQVFFSSPQRVGFSNLIDTSTSSRRRLLATQTSVYAYVVSDTSADDMANINQPKTFMSEEDILKVLQQSADGTPAPGLSSSSLDVATVSPFQETESGDSNSFFDSTAAIVLFCLLGLLLLIGIILLVWCCCLRKDKKGSSDRKESIRGSDTVNPIIGPTPNSVNKGTSTGPPKPVKNGQPPRSTYQAFNSRKAKSTPRLNRFKGNQVPTKSKGTTTADMNKK